MRRTVRTYVQLVVPATGLAHVVPQLLPELTTSFTARFPDCRVRFRIDRGAQLRSNLTEGRIDPALLLGPADEPAAQTVGELELTWYSVPDWVPPPPGTPIPLVAFDAPCALRSRALETLAAYGIPVRVGCEAAHLAGVQAAVRAGLGIGLMATFGQAPEGLVARDDLPVPHPLALSMWTRRGLATDLADGAAASLVRLLAKPHLPAQGAR